MANRARPRGEVIRERRKALSLTQETLSADTGIEQHVISRAETGKQLSLTTALILGARLGLSVEDMTVITEVPTARAATGRSTPADAA